MTEQSEKNRIDLKTTQVAAGSLASVTSAVAASQLGVAGTLIGAGVGSVVGTVAGAVYEHYLDRTRRHVRFVVPRRTVGSESAVVDATATAPAPADAVAVGPDTAPLPEAPSFPAALPEPPVASSEESQSTRTWLRSRRMALLASAAAGLGIAVVALTGFEAVTGQPISAAQGDVGTSIGRIFGVDPSSPTETDPRSTPSPEVSAGDESNSTSPEPNPSATATEPTPTPQPNTPHAATPVPPPTPPSDG